MKNLVKLSVLVILLSFVVSIVAFYYLPQNIASHWNAEGNADDFSSKTSLFITPVISLVLLFVFIILPIIDPLRNNYKNFSKYYEGLILVMTLFLFYLQIIIIVFNSGFNFNMSLALLPAFAILFYYLGILIENAKRNWFVGIRTPWTLASEKVWIKTHEIGGKLFKLSAILSLLGLFFENYAIWFMIIPILASAIVCIVYSYFLFKKK